MPDDFADSEWEESSDAYVDIIFERPPKSPVSKSPASKTSPRDKPAQKARDPVQFKDYCEQVERRFTDFFQRQDEVLRAQKEVRQEKPLAFTFEPESFTSTKGKKSPAAETQKRKSPAPAATFQRPKTAKPSEPPQELPPRMQEIFNESLRANQPPPPPPKPFEMRRPSESTNQIARDRTTCKIEVLFGPERQLNESKLRALLRRFAIIDAQLVQRVEDVVRIDDDSFDAERLKSLLIGAVTETDKSKLARKIKPLVVAALSNMKPVFLYTRAKQPPRYPEQSTKRQPSPPQQQEAPPPRVSRSSENYEAGQTAPRKETYQRKQKKVSPKKTKPTGAKYFPGFYDNLDFYTNNPKTIPRH